VVDLAAAASGVAAVSTAEDLAAVVSAAAALAAVVSAPLVSGLPASQGQVGVVAAGAADMAGGGRAWSASA
jgi:hypothetical protein